MSHDFELLELGLKLQLELQELTLLTLASIILLLQGTEFGLQLLILWWGGCGYNSYCQETADPSTDQFGSFPEED